MRKTVVTKKEQAFIENYAKNGGKVTKAALAAYDTKNPKRAASIGSRMIRKPKIQDALQKELKKQNITLERALKPISKALVATKKDIDGATIDDLDTQLKGSDRALKILLPPQKDNSSLNFNLNIDSAHFGGEFVLDMEESDE